MSEYTQGDFKVIYLGLFLAGPEKGLLEKLCRAEARDRKVLGGLAHITLSFRPDDEAAWRFRDLAGLAAPVRVSGYVRDEKACAAVVDAEALYRYVRETYYFTWLPQPRYPHITLSLAPGVPPKYSNELLEKEERSGDFWNGLPMNLSEACIDAIELPGRFGYVAAMPAGGSEVFFTPEHLPSRG